MRRATRVFINDGTVKAVIVPKPTVTKAKYALTSKILGPGENGDSRRETMSLRTAHDLADPNRFHQGGAGLGGIAHPGRRARSDWRSERPSIAAPSRGVDSSV